MRNNIYINIGGSSSGAAACCNHHKLSIVHCKLSIIHCQLSIVHYSLFIVLFFLFAGSLSAQDNYTVVIKCTPIANQNGYMVRKSSSNGNQSYSLSTSDHVIALQTTTKYYTIASVGFANFNIANVPTNLTIGAAALTFDQVAYHTSSHAPVSVYGITATPTANNSNEYTKLVSRIVYNSFSYYSSVGYSPTTPKEPYAAFSNKGTNATTTYSQYLVDVPYGWTTVYSTDFGNSTSKWGSAFPTGNQTLTNSTFVTKYHDVLASMYTVSSTIMNEWLSSAGAKYFAAYYDVERARKSSITSFGIAFDHECNYNMSNQPIFAPTSAMNILITYVAPWSCVLAPSVRTASTMACANSGVISLSASQNNATMYVPIVATKTWQWYSGTNGSNGSYTTMGGTFTATSMPSTTVQAPSNTGSVWYKYIQTIKLTSNATCTLVPNTSSKTFSVTCRPASVYISQCCTFHGSSPSFSATQVRDRSVNLEWSGMDHVDHYVIRYGVDGGVSFYEINVDRNTTSKLIERLTNGRSYYFQIYAIGADGYCDTQLSDKTYLTPNCQ